MTRLKGEIHNLAIIMEIFNIPLSIGRIRQNISKDIDTCTPPTTNLINNNEYSFFSNEQDVFSRIKHMPGHKTSLNKWLK